jgi:hypothetical protein
MGNQSDIDRAAFLKSIARQPAKALQHWGRLKSGEKLYVESQMRRLYDAEFARKFTERASTGARPDLSTEITNDRLTPERLKALGYRFKQSSGGASIWVHPSGKELWLLSQPKGTAPLPPPGPDNHPSSNPLTHPDVEDSRSWADSLEATRDELWQDAIRLKSMKTPDGAYPMGPYQEYMEKYKKYYNDWQSVLKDEVPLWKSSPLTDDEARQLDDNIKRLEKLSEYPQEMEDLGTF